MSSLRGAIAATSDETGAVLVLFSVFMSVAILLSAFVIDIGNWFEHERHLQAGRRRRLRRRQQVRVPVHESSPTGDLPDGWAVRRGERRDHPLGRSRIVGYSPLQRTDRPGPREKPPGRDSRGDQPQDLLRPVQGRHHHRRKGAMRRRRRHDRRQDDRNEPALLQSSGACLRRSAVHRRSRSACRSSRRSSPPPSSRSSSPNRAKSASSTSTTNQTAATAPTPKTKCSRPGYSRTSAQRRKRHDQMDRRLRAGRAQGQQVPYRGANRARRQGRRTHRRGQRNAGSLPPRLRRMLRRGLWRRATTAKHQRLFHGKRRQSDETLRSGHAQGHALQPIPRYVHRRLLQRLAPL